jgi:hypothetical protein
MYYSFMLCCQCLIDKLNRRHFVTILFLCYHSTACHLNAKYVTNNPRYIYGWKRKRIGGLNAQCRHTSWEGCAPETVHDWTSVPIGIKNVKWGGGWGWGIRDIRLPSRCMRSSLFWDVTQRRLVVFYRPFGTKYWPHLQAKSSLLGLLEPWR